MKRILLSLALLVASVGGAMAQTPEQQNPMLAPIPADAAVRAGTLPNGLTYYIRHNEKPKGLAEFYILHHVGAIQENDRQQGLAHFLEHMAFNGTKNMPGKQMIEALERGGVKFGADLNAYTNWDETNYNLSNVPTNNPGLIDTVMLTLHDWSHFIALDPKEIDEERGVIMEELRTRDGAPWRSMLQMIGALHRGSKYAERNLIGSLEGLKSFSHQEIVDFYNKWYRPENQSIIIVGDLDVDQIENNLKTLMADIPASPADAPKKEAYVTPDHAEPTVSVFADKEQTLSMVRVFFLREATPRQYNNTLAREVQDGMNAAITMMIDNRMQEISMQPDAPFLGGGASLQPMGVGMNPNHESAMIAVATREGELMRGYNALMAELEKVRRYGFTAGEYQLVKDEMTSQNESTHASAADRTNAQFVQTYLEASRSNHSYPDAETEYQLNKMLIANIPLEQINQYAQMMLAPTNETVYMLTPLKEGVSIPTEAEILAAREAGMKATVEAYKDTMVREPLIDPKAKLKGSKVAKTAAAPFEATEWTLKNGIKVVVKPSTLEADQVILQAHSLGGTSVLNDDVALTGALWPEMSANMGLGKFSATELQKQMMGKQASLSTFVGENENGLNGMSTPRDLETLLQLLYLQFTAPRFSETDFNTFLDAKKQEVQNKTADPAYIFNGEQLKTIYNNSPRKQQVTVEQLEGVKFANLPAVFRALYPGADSFRFTIVGNVDLDTLKPLVEKYIGSLPVSKNKLTFEDRGVRRVRGDVSNTFRTKMIQPKVSESFIWSMDTDFTLKNRLMMQILGAALTKRYQQSIREEKGGTYGVGVSGMVDFLPAKQAVLKVQYDTNEAMADELAPIVLAELAKIAKEGPIDADLEPTRDYMSKSFRSALENNNMWLSMIDMHYRFDEDVLRDFDPTLAAITADDIRALAARLIESGNLIHVTMRPL